MRFNRATVILFAVGAVLTFTLFSKGQFSWIKADLQANSGRVGQSFRAVQGVLGAEAAGGSSTVFLPFVAHAPRIFPTVLLGVYPQGYVGIQGVVDNQLHGLDAWASPGARLSLAGTFIDFEEPNPAVDIPSQLESLWANGYTGFVNISSVRTANQIANGNIDNGIRSFADAYNSWVQMGGGRFAFLAPLPEMNGNWVPYGQSPAGYKAAFARIQQIFAQRGVPPDSVRWVFAPNGWTPPGSPSLESYYPGDQVVDFVAFSGYNFGYHPYTPTPVWQDPDQVYGPYLDQMVAMAPNKAILIAQTATTAYYTNGPSTAAKNQWLREAYTYLAAHPSVMGIMYFNTTNWQGVDWPFYIPGNPAQQYEGYRDAVTDPFFEYMSPQTLSQTTSPFTSKSVQPEWNGAGTHP